MSGGEGRTEKRGSITEGREGESGRNQAQTDDESEEEDSSENEDEAETHTNGG